ncbi:MAG: sulfotransferase [Porticoccaceae bacterium]
MKFDTSADDLLRLARQRAGLEDYGEDLRFLVPFRKMVDAVNAETDFSAEGRDKARERFLRLLVNRLRFQDDLKKHPEILDQEILPPLVVLGMPRTGSTKLHRMLWQGGDFIGMLMWQGYNFAPFPDARPDGEDPRIESAAEFLSWRAGKHAVISKAHHAEALEPEEEIYLLEPSFSSWIVHGYYQIPSYIDWLRHQDRDHAYQYLRQLLQYLQWQHHRHETPRRWILKAIPHIGYEADMLRHFPGTKFVMLHRKPQEVIPSIISLTYGMRHQYSDSIADKEEIGRWLLGELSGLMQRHMAWRETVGADTVIDMAYEDVRAKDYDIAREVYDFCGMDFTDKAWQGMADWLKVNIQHSQGEHVYSLEGTGVTEADIDVRFADYMTKYRPFIK